MKSLEFSTSGLEEHLAALPGDKLLLLYTMHGIRLEDLVWIENQTIAQSYLLQKPRAKARSMVTKAGFMVFTASTLVATILHISPYDKIFLATVTPSAVRVAVYVTKRKSKISLKTKIHITDDSRALAQKLTTRNI